ncbi:hypothetical protein [Amycolatopsis aidingensis]|uniref:hypothetical protein n=1 Tax=Amycolatopsis aidingensis TaxID=2842453 RepID=UPI002FCBDDE9
MLGLRAGALAAAANSAAALPGVAHAPAPPLPAGPGAFAADGFHPGPDGYRERAHRLAAALYPPG